METFEAAAKAVADPNRARILKMLEGGELCVCQITTVLGLANPTVSAHLAQLRRAGLTQQRRDGKWVYYALAEAQKNTDAHRMLALLSKSLNQDDDVRADRAWLAALGQVPVTDLCGTKRAATVATVASEANAATVAAVRNRLKA